MLERIKRYLKPGTDEEELPALSKFPEAQVKVVEDIAELKLLACTCGSVHFRHAGYFEIQTPFIEADSPTEVKTVLSNTPVRLCVVCKKAYISYNSKVYDVTKFINLEAWEKTEKEAHKATGPGGQC